MGTLGDVWFAVLKKGIRSSSEGLASELFANR
jgi:hypothetical protein